MRRIGLQVLFVTSLGICVTTLILWPISYFKVPYIRSCLSAGYLNDLAIQRGRVVPSRFVERSRRTMHLGTAYVSVPNSLTPPGIYAQWENIEDWDGSDNAPWHIDAIKWNVAGLTYAKYPSGDLEATFHEISFPIWWISVLSAIIPAFVSWRYALRRRRLNNHCIACGYDLRATPEKCPECGTPATKQ